MCVRVDGRFSQDVDLDATHRNGFEADIEAAFAAHTPYHGIRFAVPNFRYSQDGNFSGTVRYEHQNGSGAFELQIYDLYLWTSRPFDPELVRRLAALKAWTDRRGQPRFDAEPFLAGIQPANFRWEDIQQLVPRGMPTDRETICRAVRERFAFLATPDAQEQLLLDDQTAHRELELFSQLRADARTCARSAPR